MDCMFTSLKVCNLKFHYVLLKSLVRIKACNQFKDLKAMKETTEIKSIARLGNIKVQN